MSHPFVLHLPFLAYKEDLIIKQDKGNRKIWDPARKKFVRITPEEMVRQLLIQYLIQDRSYSFSLISVEKTLSIQNRTKRFDLLVYNHETNPFILIECKSPKVKIDQTVLDQVAHYNRKLRVPYLIVTNGIETFVAHIDYDKHDFTFLKEIPRANVDEEE